MVDAINSKFPHNNLVELYYNVGRALPFTAQRFPDGRVSDWYRSQYVEVVKVEPRGKYGKVYGPHRGKNKIKRTGRKWSGFMAKESADNSQH